LKKGQYTLSGVEVLKSESNETLNVGYHTLSGVEVLKSESNETLNVGYHTLSGVEVCAYRSWKLKSSRHIRDVDPSTSLRVLMDYGRQTVKFAIMEESET